MKRETQCILDNLLTAMPEFAACERDIRSVFDLIRQSYENAGKLLICGNGGSACDSGHIAVELMKGFLLKRQIPAEDAAMLEVAFPGEGRKLSTELQRALPAISLPDQTSVMTAFANDVSADMAYAQLTYGYGKPCDVLMGISTSGNSQSVLNAVKVARAMKIRAVGLTGQDGGKLAGLCDVAIRVPSVQTYRVQEYHVCIYHALCAMLEYEFFN